MEKSLKELRAMLPRKYRYAAKVAERLNAAGYEIDEMGVYNTVKLGKGVYADAVRKVLTLMIAERKERQEAIV